MYVNYKNCSQTNTTQTESTETWRSRSLYTNSLLLHEAEMEELHLRAHRWALLHMGFAWSEEDQLALECMAWLPRHHLEGEGEYHPRPK